MLADWEAENAQFRFHFQSVLIVVAIVTQKAYKTFSSTLPSEKN